MASAPEVQKVYLDQFEKDFTTFLNLRSEEMVAEGHLLLTMVAKVDEDADDGSDPKQVIGMILNDMANEVRNRFSFLLIIKQSVTRT